MTDPTGAPDHGPEPQRLFIGSFPTGIVYADRAREENGDYKRLALLDYQTLELEWRSDTIPPELKQQILDDAAAIQAKRGQELKVTTSGQTVLLGGDPSRPGHHHRR
jgi:hypothetical protein